MGSTTVTSCQVLIVCFRPPKKWRSISWIWGIGLNGRRMKIGPIASLILGGSLVSWIFWGWNQTFVDVWWAPTCCKGYKFQPHVTHRNSRPFISGLPMSKINVDLPFIPIGSGGQHVDQGESLVFTTSKEIICPPTTGWWIQFFLCSPLPGEDSQFD